MKTLRRGLRNAALRGRAAVKPAVNATAGALAVALLKGFRRTDPDRMANFCAAVARRVGPWLSEQRVGRNNLAAAFPEKSPHEIDAILDGVWDNLGRLGAEYAHLDRLWDYDPARPGAGRIELAPGVLELFERIRQGGKPALFFTAHLANWELPAVAATAHDLDMAVLYRRPNIGDVADAVQRIRTVSMGTLIPTSGVDAAFKVAAALERGTHVGMVVDQHFTRGVDVTFFGRTCKANPMIARMARRYESPIHGARVIRLPDHRFRLDVTEAIEPARTANGQIDVVPTMQAVTATIEGWVREYPEQWLWLHRRWR